MTTPDIHASHSENGPRFVEQDRPTAATITVRALGLKCPRCGGGKLFSGLFKMNPRCKECQFSFHREAGFYLGSIYMNYGLTSLTMLTSYMLGNFVFNVPQIYLVSALTLFSLTFPLFAFRYARALWLAFDCRMDPAVLHDHHE